jgi:phosphoglucosamine mutase
MLQAAVHAGLLLGGAVPCDLGRVPTPLVPFAVLRRKLDGGVMITASHNPVPDNGLKFFDGTGCKLTPELEQQISLEIDAPGWLRQSQRVAYAAPLGLDVRPDYLGWLRRLYSRPSYSSAASRVVLDCAWGATAELAPQAFEQCGYTVTALNAAFDGRRVNVGSGTTDLSALCRAVRRRKAPLGIAFDGDGDRMLAVDERGEPVSGDRILALFAVHLPRYKRQRGIVMTQMTNLGVERALESNGVHMLRTEVGDIRVFAGMVESGLNLGGEQSGHIIMRDRLPTGDGIAAGLQLAALVAASGRPLSQLVAGFPEYPQQLTNLVVRDRIAWQRDRRLAKELDAIRAVHPQVRFYLRPSGTENLLRVLTESENGEACRAANEQACAAIRRWDGA